MAKSKARRPYGSGNITKLADNKYLVQASNGRRHDGSRRRMSKVVYGSQTDAEIELVRLRTELGVKPNKNDSLTLSEYFEGIFVPVRGKLMRKKTLDGYQSIYRNHIKPYFGDWKADTIGRADVQRWVVGLPTPATSERAFRHFRAIMRAMWEDELLDEEPLRRPVKLPRHTVQPTDVWTVEEVTEALSRLRGHQMEAIALAVAGGGLRREEALALDLPGDLVFSDAVDIETRQRTVICRFLIRKSWVNGDDQMDETKTYRIRPVTIGDPFASRLQEIVADGRSKLLMRKDGSRPLQPSSLCETWSRAFGKKGPLHGMRYVEFRTLRHFHETVIAREGMDDGLNSKVHGHSGQVMFRHYLTMAERDADTAAELMRRAMTG